MSKSISKNELAVIQLLVQHGNCTITKFEELLGVTATAVRQRLNRLMAAGLVDRQSESEGRGRPIHKYQLTEAGRKQGGNNLSDFAVALWEEVQTLSDESVRQAIISGATRRLANTYNQKIEGDSIQDRMASVAKLFAERDIPIEFEQNNQGLPILKILACPYPDLANENQNVCEMERQLLAEVTGGSLELCQCRRDGDSCCTFQQPESSQNHSVQPQTAPTQSIQYQTQTKF